MKAIIQNYTLNKEKVIFLSNLDEKIFLSWEKTHFLINEIEFFNKFNRLIDFHDEGLYRLLSPEFNFSQQYLFCKNDITALACGISQSLMHGIEDNITITNRRDGKGGAEFNGIEFEKLLITIINRNLSVTCGTAARLFSYACGLIGYESRILGFKNNRAKFGTSHVMAEIYLPIKNKCILIDVDLGVYFESNDEILSYNDIHFKLKNNEPFVIKNLINHKKANFVDFSHDFILGSKAGRKFFLQEVFSADPVSSIWEVENGSKFLRPKETKRLWTPYL